MSVERWLPVRGYETHYDVSDLGRVRRTLGCRGATAGRIMKLGGIDGYQTVSLCKADRKRRHSVHVLVAEAFLGKRPRGKVPNHKNLDRGDNRLGNLEWLTPKQNAQHAIRLGRISGGRSLGEANGRSKLTVAQVALIRRLKGKVGQREIALLAGVCKTAIQKIHQEKMWRAPA